MSKIIHNIRNLKQLWYSGRFNFLNLSGEMVKKLFSSLPGQMLKKFFGKQGLLIIFLFYLKQIAGIKFFNFVLGCCGKLKFSFFMCPEEMKLFFIAQRSPASL